MNSESTLCNSSNDLSCRKLLLEADWSASSLGAAESWHPVLKLHLNTILNSPFPMQIFWGTELLTFYNDAFIQNIGRHKHPEALGKPGAVVYSELWSAMQFNLSCVFNNGAVRFHENERWTVERQGKSEDRYFTYSLSPIIDAEGQILGVLVISNETTLQLRDAEHLRLALQAGQLGTFELNLQTYEINCSDRYRANFGLAPDVPLSFVDIAAAIHPEDLPRMRGCVQRAIADHTVYRCEYRIRRPDGSEHWISAQGQPQYGDRGQPVRMIGIVENVTEKVLVRRKVEETAQQLSLAMECAEMGTWFLDLTIGRYTVSQQTRHILGISEDAGELYEAMQRLIHPEDLCEVNRVLNQAINNKIPYTQEFRLMRPDGTMKWILSRGNCVYSEAGHAVTMSGILMDISQRKQAEQNLRDAKEQAESASQLKSAFLANMSHEIRTPLGVMIGFADLMSDPELTPADRKNFARTLKRNGEQLSVLIDDILDLSKVEAGQLKVETVNFSLRELIEDLIGAMRVKALEKGVQLKVDYALAHEDIANDPHRLRQILWNLIGNGLKFTSAGEVHVSVTGNGDQLALEVADTGIGIPHDQRARLFKAFCQGDDSMTRRFGGTGLGLALSGRLANLLGGELVLKKSEVGIGSIFRLTIPHTKRNEALGYQ